MVGSHLHRHQTRELKPGLEAVAQCAATGLPGTVLPGAVLPPALGGCTQEGEGQSLPTFPCLVPTPPVFGKTTPPRVTNLS